MSKAEPTPDQLRSREEVQGFLSRVRPLVQQATQFTKSLLGSDKEMEAWIERGRALGEIEDSVGFRLIMQTVENEIKWGQAKVEQDDCVDKELVEVRAYLRCLRFVKNYVLTVNRNADISSRILAGRVETFAKDDAFVKAIAPPR